MVRHINSEAGMLSARLHPPNDGGNGSSSKTQKNRAVNGHSNKNEMWKRLESAFIAEEEEPLSQLHAAVVSAKPAAVECVYNPSGNRERCDVCHSNIVITEDGFATCTNARCSIIYKDVLDQSAEWRFYGADDNQMTDPTRCGMPVNPLLMESSYGCKVLCEGASSYEMRKIRRYTEWQSMPYAEKSLYDEFERIKNTASNAGIPKMIIDCALRYHKKISEHKTFCALRDCGMAQ